MKKRLSARKRRPDLFHERRAHRAGFRRVAGVDEAGRGPLAGPVVAAALLLKDTKFKNRIDDSKKLTPRARLLAYKEIIGKAWIGIGVADEKVIDRINVYNATAAAMEEAIDRLSVKPDLALIDGRVRLKRPCRTSCIINGDSKCLSIACASIVAKVTRDNIMARYHKKYPQYGFLRHKGYATKEHIRQLEKHGPSPAHRFTFRPIRGRFTLP